MEIHVKPSKKQIFSGSLQWLVLNILALFGCLYFAFTAHFLLMLLPLGGLLYTMSTLLCRWAECSNSSWIITQEDITQKKGIFTLVTSHVELYRIADYQETQDFCQRLLGVKTLHLIGRDQWTRVVSITGIPASSNLMKIIRERVEICRRNKNIHEHIYH